MTRTEERLTAALRETARSVREGSLSPLVVPAARRSRWARRLAPVAAAAAVALIAVLALVLPGGANPPPVNTALPRYYVVLQSAGAPILILSTSTGSFVGSGASPGRAASGSLPENRWLPAGVAAAGDGRFVAVYTYLPPYSPAGSSRNQSQTRLYSFQVTASGHATRLTLVHGGVLTGLVPDQAGGALGNGLAVSPDGSRVALAVDPAPPCRGPNSCPVEIAVINTRTGQRELWTGGLNRSGQAPAITGISWASNSGPLVFLAQWCPRERQGVAICAFDLIPDHVAQVRTLNLGSEGGSLARGSVLLGQSARYPEIAAASLVPGRAALAVVVFTPLGRQGLKVRVVDVPLGGGGQPSVLYHTSLSQFALNAGLSPDASGRHWLLAISDSSGWIGDPGDGRLHRLPPPRPDKSFFLSPAYGAW